MKAQSIHLQHMGNLGCMTELQLQLQRCLSCGSKSRLCQVASEKGLLDDRGGAHRMASMSRGLCTCWLSPSRKGSATLPVCMLKLYTLDREE